MILCFLILFADGLDFSAANVAAPAILRAFHAEKSAMGFVFGWGYFGIFLGSLFFGWIGDRFGRKVGAISGVLAYSLPALATVFASSLDQLALLRFLAGLGIGGVIPNTIALLNETAPKRFRASFVMVAFLGYSAGIASTGLIAARFLPEFGWPVVFLAAGIAGTVLGIVLAFVLPESVRFLTLAAPDSPRLRILFARIAPESPVDAHARFFLHGRYQEKILDTPAVYWKSLDGYQSSVGGILRGSADLHDAFELAPPASAKARACARCKPPWRFPTAPSARLSPYCCFRGCSTNSARW